MPETTYTYDIAADTGNGKVNTSDLSAEILASTIVIAVERIDTTGGTFANGVVTGGSMDVVMKDAITKADLDAVVAAHVGIEELDPSLVSLDLPKAADGTLLVRNQSLVLGQDRFIRTDDGTALMNVDGRSTGSTFNVWNGTGAGDTGADFTHSGVGSESAAAANSGTNGLDTGLTTLNSVSFFDYGSMQDVAGTYDELTFFLQAKAFPGGSNLQIGWVDDTDSLVGNFLQVANYITSPDLNMWMEVTIPLADFNLGGNAQKLVFRYAGAANQRYWIDDITLAEAAPGGPYVFRVAAPDANTRYHVSMLVLVATAPASGWNSTAFVNINNGLDKGVIVRHRRISDGEVFFNLNSKDNADLFGRFHPQDSFTFADNVILLGLMLKPGKASIVITDDDVLEFIVRDDLSAIPTLRAFVHYGRETLS